MSPNSKRLPARIGALAPAHHQYETMASFRARLESGDFDAIVGRKLRRTLRVAAQDTGLDVEVGALRLSLIRLLQEEHDPARLATGVARITAIAVQAAQLRSRDDSEMNEIEKILVRELAVIEAENAQRAQESADLRASNGDT
jgi:hypothetical protein